MYSHLQLFIDGEWIGSNGRRTAPVVNPANNDVLAELPFADDADLDRAIESSLVAFRSWSRKSAHERAAVLKKVAQLIRERAERIAIVLCLEEGKTLAEARGEVGFAADVFEWDAEACRHDFGAVVPGRDPNCRYLMTREPVGPVAAFTPWNFPAVTPARKIAGALAAGCTCVLKASEETPGTAVEIVRACRDAGVPDGVVNLVFGDPAAISSRLIGSGVMRKITFTGSTAVGRELARLSAEHLLPATLELGGHGPVIVAGDADPAFAAKSIASSKFLRNAGQVCTSPSRLFVHKSIYSRFAEELTNIAHAIVIGDGMEKSTQMGPLANDRRLNAMAALTEDARKKGATVKAGGQRRSDTGNFWEPTVLTDLAPDSDILNEEPFGPIAPVIPFDDVEEAIDRANDLPFGLAGYVYTNNLGVARHLERSLEVGVVSVNNVIAALPETSFGGVKYSGYGREGGPETLRDYLVTKMINES